MTAPAQCQSRSRNQSTRPRPPAHMQASTVASTARRPGAAFSSASSRNGGEKDHRLRIGHLRLATEHERVPPRRLATAETVGEELDLRLEVGLGVPWNGDVAGEPRPSQRQKAREIEEHRHAERPGGRRLVRRAFAYRPAPGWRSSLMSLASCCRGATHTVRPTFLRRLQRSTAAHDVPARAWSARGIGRALDIMTGKVAHGPASREAGSRIAATSA